jgi:hypothetical protein
VTFKVIWEPVAVSVATRFLAEDPMDCVTCSRLSMLSRTSHTPPDAFPLNTSGLYRLRVGWYRAVYQVDETLPDRQGQARG